MKTSIFKMQSILVALITWSPIIHAFLGPCSKIHKHHKSLMTSSSSLTTNDNFTIRTPRKSPSSMNLFNPTLSINSHSKYNSLPKSINHKFISSPHTHPIHSKTSLQMGFNLPPPKGQNDILPGLLTIAALFLFFFSPLGGIFFAVTNSLFVLALLTPILFTIGFQLWQSFYTIEGSCPNCGSSVRVLKDDVQPSICLGCGSLVRATVDKSGVELCNDPNSILNDDGAGGFGSLFDSFFGNPASSSSGGFYQEEQEVFVSKSSSSSSSSMNKNGPSSRQDKAKRDTTIIDVDVVKDD